MTNRESLARHIKNIDEQLGSLEYYCDTEIVGDDARHLLADIHAAQREHLRMSNETLTVVEDLKPIYDRLKRINSSVKVMRNTLAQCEKAIASAIDSADHAAENLSKDTDEDEDL
jgi:predicted  nucleic acid-binding Zn-ribbon protein